jgi:hypothetical protein
MIQWKSLQRIKKIPKKDFEKKFLETEIPVVIENIYNDADLTKKWTLHHFKKEIGDITVPVFDSRIKKDESAYTQPDLYMKFGEFLDDILYNPKPSYRMFLFNMFREYPKIREDFPVPEYADGLLKNLGFMFFGGRDTKVRNHFDLDMNHVFHTHYEGKKIVILCSPENNVPLYKLPFNSYTLVDIDKPDFEKYPALKYVNGYKTELQTGDTLYIPPGYWHFMHYLEPGYSISYRKQSKKIINSLKGLNNLTLNLTIDKLLNLFFKKSWVNCKISYSKLMANKYIVEK